MGNCTCNARCLTGLVACPVMSTQKLEHAEPLDCSKRKEGGSQIPAQLPRPFTQQQEPAHCQTALTTVHTAHSSSAEDSFPTVVSVHAICTHARQPQLHPGASMLQAASTKSQTSVSHTRNRDSPMHVRRTSLHGFFHSSSRTTQVRGST